MKDFYATYDLMHVCTTTNLLALATEVSGKKIDEEHNSTLAEFNTLIDELYDKTSYLHKWTNLNSLNDIAEDDMNVDNDDESDDDDIDIQGKFIASIQNSQRNTHDVDENVAEEDEMMNFHLGNYLRNLF